MLGGPGLGGHVVEVEVLDDGPAGDLVGHLAGDEAELALGPGESGEDVEPGGEAPLVVEEGVHLRGGPQVGVDRRAAHGGRLRRYSFTYS